MEKSLASVVLPEELSAQFEVVGIEDHPGELHFHMDERPEPPQAYGVKYLSQGFTDPATVQDFPIRGKAVFLHLRRRKWLDPSTGHIVSRSFDVTHKGTRLTKELVAFLKATN